MVKVLALRLMNMIEGFLIVSMSVPELLFDQEKITCLTPLILYS